MVRFLEMDRVEKTILTQIPKQRDGFEAPYGCDTVETHIQEPSAFTNLQAEVAAFSIIKTKTIAPNRV